MPARSRRRARAATLLAAAFPTVPSVLATLLAAAAPLLSAFGPQAGGGGSFGTGGGGGGGDFGGGDGLGEILWLLVRLVFHFPRLGVPLVLVACVVVVLGLRQGWWKHQERVIARAAPRRQALRAAEAVAALRARDPGFDEARFLARVGRAFARAQESWCAQALEPLWPFVSDGVLERFTLQIEEQRAEGWRQGIDGLALEPPALLHVASGRHFDALTVRLAFRADVHRVALAKGERIEGSRIPRERFVECWSFVRRLGARSANADGLLEGACPQCGAPLALNRSARCAHCQSQVKSGAFDWVLAEITQESEWRASDEAGVRGLATQQARDPGFDVQMLEDHASVVFWRWRAAERAGRAEALSRVAEPALCERLDAGWAGARERTLLADAAVGSVRTLGCLAEADGERALVEIVWDGRRTTLGGRGVGRVEAGRVLRRTVLVLARPAGAQSDLRLAFTTLHCRECGAADPGGSAATCAYCGAPRRDPGSWLLREVLEAGSAEERRLADALRALPAEPPAARAALAAGASVTAAAAAPAALPPDAARAAGAPSNAGLLAWAVALAAADGAIEERERRAVRALGARLGVPEERVALLLAQPAADGAAGPGARDAHEAHAWLDALVALALADGGLARGERRFLRLAAGRLGIDRAGLAARVRLARRALYRDARAARRATSA